MPATFHQPSDSALKSGGRNVGEVLAFVVCAASREFTFPEVRKDTSGVKLFASA
ncbi:hypothetical protein ZHAS_00020006 [Anopheles sinensis]|uniref:Uncharacterized protein n=1 Tax=Anopheles sinensis TaxID=74873 RepID=A0A084WNL8_ANOSI|nr:hypothetical protein ZHAS_00020006 [Anopheles sinensis]